MSFERTGLAPRPWLPRTKTRLHPFGHMAHWPWEQLYMPRVRGGDQRMISLRSLSISLGPECLLSARAAKQALEKCQGGCGSVAHITGEPLIMSIGTRAPSSSVSSTETKRRGASHVRRALAMRPCLVSELTDITTRSVRGHGALGWAYSAITRSRGSHATGILDSLRIEQAIL